MTEETYTFFQQFHGYDNLYNAFHMFKLKWFHLTWILSEFKFCTKYSASKVKEFASEGLKVKEKYGLR